MTNRIAVARAVAEHLFATEEAIDQALSRAAALVGFMPEARQQIGVSAKVGQPAIEQVAASITMLSNARRMLVQAHESLAVTAAEARVPAHNFGGFVDKPSAAARGDIALVAERKAG